MWNLLQDNGFFLTISPYFLYPFLGSNLPHGCHPQPLKARGLPVLTNITPTRSVRCCSAELRDRGWEQRRCEGTAGRAGRGHFPTLHNPADESWQGPAQRGAAAVQPPEPARHAEAALAPVSDTISPGTGCASLRGAKSRLTHALGTWGHTQ